MGSELGGDTLIGPVATLDHTTWNVTGANAGTVDLTDFTFQVSNFNYALPASAGLRTPAPEPAALSLLLTAAAGSVVGRRRRHR